MKSRIVKAQILEACIQKQHELIILSKGKLK
jgi:hypothetical protein